MVYLLFGADDLLVHEELARIKAGLGPQDMLGLNTTVLAGDKVAPAELKAVCDAVPFLAPARLVIVERLLRRFEGGRPGRRNARASAAEHEDAPPAEEAGSLTRSAVQPARQNAAAEPLEGWRQIADYCRQMPDTTHLVFMDGVLRPRNPLLRLLSPVADVREQRRLRGPALEQWVRERLALMHGRIAPSAVQMLVQMAGDNLWVLSSELEKLSLYAGDTLIQDHHVREVVASARESTIFLLVDAVAEQHLAAAQRALHQLLRDGLAPPYILFMLARQFRLLLLARTLVQKGVTGSELMARLEITAEYPFRKTLEQSRRYTARSLEAALRRVLDADVAMKTGKLDPEVALELLVADLCRSVPARA